MDNIRIIKLGNSFLEESLARFFPILRQFIEYIEYLCRLCRHVWKVGSKHPNIDWYVRKRVCKHPYLSALEYCLVHI